METIAQYCGYFTGIAAVIIMLVKPVRDRVFGLNDIRDGIRCQLRADMLRTYYKHNDENTIRQYEIENFIYQYKAYKALKGNSFVDKVYKEVMTWDVTS